MYDPIEPHPAYKAPLKVSAWSVIAMTIGMWVGIYLAVCWLLTI